MDSWVSIRYLKAQNPTLGTRKIAALANVSRNTVIKALRSSEYPSYKKRESRVKKDLEPFLEFIKESYLFKNQKVSVIVENLKSKGFSGSLSSVYRHINATLKQEKHNRAFMPYETSLGEQMQFDWSPYTVNIGGKPTTVYVHSLIMGYSRYKVFDVSLELSQNTVFGVIEKALFEIGGCAKRIQVDNAKQFVSDPSLYNFKWNPKFLEFVGCFSIEPTRSLPYHPWSKGKVERTFPHLEDHFINNCEFYDLEDFIRKLKIYQDTQNSKIHSVTRHSPKELLQKELPFLITLPSVKYTDSFKIYRKVSNTSLISYNSSKYSVPSSFALKHVWVKPNGLYLEIYSDSNALIAKHILSTQKACVVMDTNHYEKHQNTYGELKKRFMNRFCNYKNANDFLKKLSLSSNQRYTLLKTMELFDYYDEESCISAMQECFDKNCFNVSFLRGIMQKITLKQEDIQILHNIELPKANVKRNLTEYAIW